MGNRGINIAFDSSSSRAFGNRPASRPFHTRFSIYQVRHKNGCPLSRSLGDRCRKSCLADSSSHENIACPRETVTRGPLDAASNFPKPSFARDLRNWVAVSGGRFGQCRASLWATRPRRLEDIFLGVRRTGYQCSQDGSQVCLRHAIDCTKNGRMTLKPRRKSAIGFVEPEDMGAISSVAVTS